jgi:hypothetical protein
VEEDAKLAAEGKQNPWDQFPGRSRPYLRARVGKMKKKKNTSEVSRGITFSNPAMVGVADRVKTLAAQGSDGSFLGLGTMIVTPNFKGKTECIDHVYARIKLHTRNDIVNTKISAT